MNVTFTNPGVDYMIEKIMELTTGKRTLNGLCVMLMLSWRIL